MDQQIFVYVDLDGAPHLVGRLWLHNRKRVESATFRYDEEWLRNPRDFLWSRRFRWTPRRTTQRRGGVSSARLAIRLRIAGDEP